MRRVVCALFVGIASVAQAQDSLPPPSALSWGAGGGGSRTGGRGASGGEWYFSLQLQWLPTGSRNGWRVELSNDVEDVTYRHGPSCPSCVTSSSLSAGSAGGMVSWVHEWRPNSRVRPYTVLGMGVFQGDRILRPGSCAVRPCQRSEFQQPEDLRGIGLARAMGVGMSVSAKRMVLFGELRGSYIGGDGSRGTDGLVIGARFRQ